MRRRLAGDDATPAVDVAAVLVVVVGRTERAVVLVREGVGEAGMFAASRRGTSVRKSPVEFTDGALPSEPAAFDQEKELTRQSTLTSTRQWAMVMCAYIPVSGENTRVPRACR